jgi:cyclic-di-GMP phosphodiesterase TipF (flagellum assembly factor)
MPARAVATFAGLDRDGIIALLRGAIEAHRINLYLQPIVTLPQRKVRYYEAMSRLKADSGEVVAAADFLPYAEAGSLMPKLDALSVLRCVQVVRRLLLKNRDIGLFCNLSGATLTDAEFPQFLEFVDANRAIASALVFEFTQSASVPWDRSSTRASLRSPSAAFASRWTISPTCASTRAN